MPNINDTIEKLRMLLAEGAPLPWIAEQRYAGSATQTTRPMLRIPSRWPTCNDECVKMYHADTELIVAAVNALPQLLDELDRLRKGDR